MDAWIKKKKIEKGYADSEKTAYTNYFQRQRKKEEKTPKEPPHSFLFKLELVFI